jgi:RNA polymerase sigma-70 factor, ECF subfamily
LTDPDPIQAARCDEPPEESWGVVVGRIQAGDPSAMEDLYRVFSAGVRFQLWRQLGPQDLDDNVHDVFLAVAESIRKGDIREPDRLMGYVRTVVRRHVAGCIGDAARQRRKQTGLDSGMALYDDRPDPEHRAMNLQRAELAESILKTIPKRDREVLIRFYLREQPAAQICGEMDLSETQFRLIKWRAKARFGELGKSRLALHK